MTSPFHRLRAPAAAFITAAAMLWAPGSPAQAQSLSGAAPVVLTVADPSAPTAQELDDQRAEAARLQHEVEAQQEAVVTAREGLSDLAAQAGAALERHEQAVREQEAARAEQQTQTERLVAAQALLGRKRADIGRWASTTYRSGGAMSDFADLMTLLDAENTDDLSQRLAMLQRVGRMRGEVVNTVAQAEAVQADASRRAQAAALAADLAAERAAAAKQEADRLVAEQAQALSALTALLADTDDAAQTAARQAERLAAARAIAEQRRLAAQAADRRGPNLVVGEVGACAGGNVSRYPNGAIPLSALCPLWGAPGHYLRADAAYAFDRLSEAYAQDYGEPLCVTDSYRSLASQESLYATKPGLAAVPGTSNHGWGTAVDFCGGVESFGSPAHEWMRSHAPLFGFFHPEWAQAGGSRPEPWHWEFGR